MKTTFQFIKISLQHIKPALAIAELDWKNNDFQTGIDWCICKDDGDSNEVEVVVKNGESIFDTEAFEVNSSKGKKKFAHLHGTLC